MKLLEVVILSISFVYHIALLHWINTKNKGITVASGIMFTIVFYFDIIPILIYGGGAKGNDIFIEHINGASIAQFFFAELCVSLFATFFSAVATKKVKFTSGKLQFETKSNNGILHFFAYFTLIVGGASFIFYMNAFGGFDEMLKYAAIVRSFSLDTTKYISYEASLLIVPSRMIIASPVLLFSLYKIDSKKLHCFSFIFATVLAVMFLLFNSGKTQIALFVLPFAIVLLGKYFKHPWRFIFILAITFMPFLGFFDSLFYYFSYGKWLPIQTSIFSYISAFAYPFANVLNLKNIVEISGYQMFSSLITAILNFLPGVSFPPSYSYTSQLYNGVNWESKFGIPIDIITFGYIQFDVFGIIIIALLLGWLCSAINSRISALDKQKYGLLIDAITVLAFSFIVDADLGAVLKGNYLLYLGCIVLFVACKKIHVNNYVNRWSF